MDEDDSATPPDGSSGGGRRVVNRTSNRITQLRRRLVELHTLINNLEEQQEQQPDNPVLGAFIENSYKQHAAITEELDFGSGWEAYDPDAIETPLPPPIPTPAADENFVE